MKINRVLSVGVVLGCFLFFGCQTDFGKAMSQMYEEAKEQVSDEALQKYSVGELLAKSNAAAQKRDGSQACRYLAVAAQKMEKEAPAMKTTEEVENSQFKLSQVATKVEALESKLRQKNEPYRDHGYQKALKKTLKVLDNRRDALVLAKIKEKGEVFVASKNIDELDKNEKQLVDYVKIHRSTKEAEKQAQSYMQQYTKLAEAILSPEIKKVGEAWQNAKTMDELIKNGELLKGYAKKYEIAGVQKLCNGYLQQYSQLAEAILSPEIKKVGEACQNAKTEDELIKNGELLKGYAKKYEIAGVQKLCQEYLQMYKQLVEKILSEFKNAGEVYLKSQTLDELKKNAETLRGFSQKYKIEEVQMLCEVYLKGYDALAAKIEWQAKMKDPAFAYPNRDICKSEFKLFKTFSSGMNKEIICHNQGSKGQYLDKLGYFGSVIVNENEKPEVAYCFAHKPMKDGKGGYLPQADKQNAVLVEVKIMIRNAEVSFEDLVRKYAKELGVTQYKNTKKVSHKKLDENMNTYISYERSALLQNKGIMAKIVVIEGEIKWNDAYREIIGDERLAALTKQFMLQIKNMPKVITIRDDNQIKAYRKLYEEATRELRKQAAEQEAKKKADSMAF